MMQQTNDTKGSTSGTILVIILVIVVAFVVWYATSHKKAVQPEQPAVQLNVGSTGGAAGNVPQQ